MGRRPRFLAPGGIHHAHNRVPRGQPVFRDVDEAHRLEYLFALVKKRDDFHTTLPGSSHYHL